MLSQLHQLRKVFTKFNSQLKASEHLNSRQNENDLNTSAVIH